MNAVRGGYAAALALVLSGCGASGPDDGSDAGTAPRGFAALLAPQDKPDAATDLPKPLAKVVMAGGAIVVAGPTGYCIDPQSAQSRGQRGFALISSCLALSGGQIGTSVPAMIATVSVGPRAGGSGLPSAQDLAEASDAPLRAGETRDGLVAAQLGEGGTAFLEDGDKRYWRGVFSHAGRLIGLALYAPKGSALAGADGADMLVRLRDAIVDASPKPEAAPEAATGAGLLGRLFNR